MLQFILGRASTGKTYTVLNKIKEFSLNNKESVLIVPEQFTFESERQVLKTVGDSFALNTEVLSFSRLYDEVGRHTGGVSAKLLSDCEKNIFMHKALVNSKDKLRLWQKYVNSVTFAKTMLDTIGEFKINSVTSGDLLAVSENIQSNALKTKLCDIAVIYDEYDLCVGEKYIDPADCLTKLYEKLISYRYFEGKTVFLDSFKGFTGQQFRIIERILTQAENVYISLCYNPQSDKEFSVFSNIRKSIDKIKSIASSRAVKIAEPIILSDSHYNSKALASVEKIMSGETLENEWNDNSVSVLKCSNTFDEADKITTIIKKLVREENYRFKDFVIIARDLDTYKEAVKSSCEKNGISLYFDNRFPLSSFPLCVMAFSAIDALNFSTENILRMQKTGLATLEFSEISRLENYAYLWNITGDNWLTDFEMNPNGFVTDSLKEDDKKELEFLNDLRIKAVEPLINFKNLFKNNAKDMAKALIKLFRECDVNEKLRLIADRVAAENIHLSPDVLSGCYGLFMDVLDSVVTCFGEEIISQKDFTEALKVAVSLADVGTIPQMLDEVSFGSADRIRPSRPKIAFILGANQGIFPQNSGNAGIFNLSERKNLIGCDINIADNSIYSSIDEEFLVYSNLCCASDKLFISYSSKSLSGEGLERSSFVDKIINSLSVNVVDYENGSFNEDYLPQTYSSCFSQYCRNYKNNKSVANTMKFVLKDTEFANRLEMLDTDLNTDNLKLSNDVAKKLYGKNIAMSASKFDTFSRCKFSFFCRYGLKAKRIQPADFDVMQRGTIVHYCLERLVTDNMNGFSGVSESELDTLTEKYVNDYLDSVVGFRNVFTKHTEFLVSRLVRSLKEVVRHIAKELSQSDFKPIACELKIGIGDDDLKVSFPFSEGDISLFGSIDRLDKYNGYIRIIDYKTGSKSFKLPDILFGLNMQMLIYLYAVTRAQGIDDELAAGILYQPSKRDIKGEGLAMNGLLQGDEVLINAMDKSGVGEFVPKLSFNKDGSISKRSNSFIEKENFTHIFDLVEKVISEAGDKIISGDVSVDPVDGRESAACTYCDFYSVCGFENGTARQVPNICNNDVFECMKEGEKSGI